MAKNKKKGQKKTCTRGTLHPKPQTPKQPRSPQSLTPKVRRRRYGAVVATRQDRGEGLVTLRVSSSLPLNEGTCRQ